MLCKLKYQFYIEAGTLNRSPELVDLNPLFSICAGTRIILLKSTPHTSNPRNICIKRADPLFRGGKILAVRDLVNLLCTYIARWLLASTCAEFIPCQSTIYSESSTVRYFRSEEWSILYGGNDQYHAAILLFCSPCFVTPLYANPAYAPAATLLTVKVNSDLLLRC